MAGRNANGEGTIYRRKDGRYEGALFVPTVSGRRMRVRVYGATRNEVHEKLTAAKASAQSGVPVPDRAWQLGEYLDYWLENVVRPTKRPSTHEQYEWISRKFLKPSLGNISIARLSVSVVQKHLNTQAVNGSSPHRLRLVRMVLGAALARAQREELITRNVARHVEIPAYEPVERTPWTVDEARTFYEQAKEHPLYPAFILLQVYGLRRGEMLGLRWSDIDTANMLLHVQNQLQRVGGSLRQGPVKTKAGNRTLRLIEPVRQVLEEQRRSQEKLIMPGEHDTSDLVFTRGDGRPLDPDSFTMTFKRLCVRYGVRQIRVHDIRHTTATLMANHGVEEHGIQGVLGQSDISTTRHYIHRKTDSADAIERVAEIFWRSVGLRCRQTLPSITDVVERFTTPQQWYTRQDSNLRPLVPELHARNRKDRLTDVERVLKSSRQQWILGLVAVSAAVKIDHIRA